MCAAVFGAFVEVRRRKGLREGTFLLLKRVLRGVEASEKIIINTSKRLQGKWGVVGCGTSLRSSTSGNSHDAN